jgi:hypothetical protein
MTKMITIASMVLYLEGQTISVSLHQDIAEQLITDVRNKLDVLQQYATRDARKGDLYLIPARLSSFHARFMDWPEDEPQP